MGYWKHLAYPNLTFTKTEMPDEPYYTYELVYPQGFVNSEGEDLSDRVFYVGKGTVSRRPYARQRIDSHEYETRVWSNLYCAADMSRKEQVICSIWDAGMRVQKRIVFASFIKAEVEEREASLIQHYGESLANYMGNRSEVKRRYAQMEELRKKSMERVSS